MKKKARKTAARKKVPSRRAAGRSAAPGRTPDALDIEDLLISAFLNGTKKNRSTLIEDVFYSVTPSIADLGYKYGFSVGMHIYTKTGGAKNMIPEILEKLNFGKVLYNPFSDKLIITSTGRKAEPLAMGKNLHIYEAGIIAGYMSMATGLKLDANEVHCIYNRSDFCQFVCSPLTTPNFHLSQDSSKVIDALAKAIGTRHAAENGSDYSILHMLPLLRQPLLEEVAALLELAGTRLAETTPEGESEAAIGSIARNFGIERAELDASKKRKVLRLRYGKRNSINDFVTLSVQPFVGFTAAMFDSEASVYKTINRDRTYTARIELRKKVS